MRAADGAVPMACSNGTDAGGGAAVNAAACVANGSMQMAKPRIWWRGMQFLRVNAAAVRQRGSVGEVDADITGNPVRWVCSRILVAVSW